jgi:uncharacterized membrane protein
MSRRSTRIAGTRASCNNGGNVKPTNKVIAVKNPSASGPSLPPANRFATNRATSAAATLAHETERSAEYHRHDADGAQLQQTHGEREVARRTQSFHECDGVEMSLHVATRSHRHRDGARQYGH